ncbi:hypothetical protein Emag_007795 [Eimeria magna]
MLNPHYHQFPHRLLALFYRTGLGKGAGSPRLEGGPPNTSLSSSRTVNPALGALTAPRAEKRRRTQRCGGGGPSSPATPASSSISAELVGSAELRPPRAARVSRSARPTVSSRQGLLPPPSPLATAAVDALDHMGGMAGEREILAARWVRWALTAAGDYKGAQEVIEHHLVGLKWAPAVFTGLANRLRVRKLRDPEVADGQVERRIQFWLSGTERLATLMGPGQSSLREFFNGVYRTGQAFLGSLVDASVPAGPAAPPAAPSEQGAAAQPIEPCSVAATPGATGTIEASPPSPIPGPAEPRDVQPLVATRTPHSQVGLDELANGSATTADGSGSAADTSRAGFSAELLGVEQPASKRARTRGGDVVPLR